MSKLIRLLQQAHAIEIGAYHAYEGHWRSIPPTNPARLVIWTIQIDELRHREKLKTMLADLGAKPSKVLDLLLWCIGKSISVGCRVMPYRMAMWGAKIMEILGSGVYYNLAFEAADHDKLKMCHDLVEMGYQEQRHEKLLVDFLSAVERK